MFRTIALACLLPLCVHAAEQPDVASLFSFPNTLVTIVSESEEGEFSAPVSENYGRSGVAGQPLGPWTFRNGISWRSNSGSEGLSSRYLFVKSTEYGDVYLVTFTNKNGEESVMPLLYKGDKTVLEKFGIQFTIEPSP